ncbi:hypothetical protein GCM10029963_73020 [Micromonospora andamanensis]|uniref:hypothetical protein n=1 Tax=Micromonospora andamanensis TaxID=1287068 RepID=UPI00194EF3DF|nr:hypothetical protein [Micromonospora andamanensis]GIJ39738.1 hypothetical protein Vwe01_30630 [Micromonospora andamanensis]
MAQLLIRIKDDQSPPEHLDDLATDLREAIIGSGTDSVSKRSEGAAGAGTRGTELIAVGVLIVQMALDAGLFADLVWRIRDWSSRQRVQHVEIELNGSRLVVSDATVEQQQALIDHFVKATSE